MTRRGEDRSMCSLLKWEEGERQQRPASVSLTGKNACQMNSFFLFYFYFCDDLLHAARDVEQLEVAQGRDGFQRAVREKFAPADDDLLEVGARGDDGLDPIVRDLYAAAQVENLEAVHLGDDAQAFVRNLGTM